MNALCKICHRPKPNLVCDLCQCEVCKACVVTQKSGSFLFLEPLPPALSHQRYCANCYDREVAPTRAEYDRLIEAAKQVCVFVKGQSQETRFYRRLEKPLKVSGGDDRAETLLRLAFLAARAGFNGLLDVDIQYKKIRQGAYQSTLWEGTGVPTQLDEARLDRLAQPGKILLPRAPLLK